MQQATQTKTVTLNYLLKLCANNYLVYIDGKRKSLTDLSMVTGNRFYTVLSLDINSIRVTSITV